MVKQSISLQQKLGFYGLIWYRDITEFYWYQKGYIGQNQALTLIFLREFVHANVKTYV